MVLKVPSKSRQRELRALSSEELKAIVVHQIWPMDTSELLFIHKLACERLERDRHDEGHRELVKAAVDRL